MATRAMGLELPKGHPAPPSTRALPHPVWLGLASGVLLWLSFPPLEWNWAAWFSLVPLLLLVGSERSSRWVYLGAGLGGLAFWLLAIHWIWWTDQTAWLGWIAMASFLSTEWIGFVFLARFARRRLNLPLIVAAPLLWVAIEYVRAYLLTGFPWYYLAHSQYRIVYLTQIADLTGALGLSWLMATVNAYLAELLTLPIFRRQARGSWWVRLAPGQKARLVVVSVGVVGTLAYGIFRVETARFRPGPRVALLQSNEVNTYDAETRRDPTAIQASLESLVRQAAGPATKPDLIVWPETANPWGYYTFEPGLSPGRLDELAKQFHPRSTGAEWVTNQQAIDEFLARLTASTGIPMMVGSSITEFKSTGFSRFNAAILLQKGSPAQIYRKLHLVPFGEYVPLLETFPWLIRLTPYRDTKVRFLDHGPGPSWFEFGPYRLAAAICFEDTLPHEVRRFFAEAPDGKQPDLLVNLSNDGWFHQTVRARDAPRRQRLPVHREPGPARQGGQHRDLGDDRRQRPDHPIPRQTQGRGALRSRPARRPDIALLPMGRLVRTVLPRLDHWPGLPRDLLAEEVERVRIRPDGETVIIQIHVIWVACSRYSVSMGSTSRPNIEMEWSVVSGQ